MRPISSEYGDLSSSFDMINEIIFNNKFLKRIIINIQGSSGNKGKIKGHLALEIIFGFCETFK